MRHAKAMAWEARLKAVFDRIDRELENRYAGRFPLHPARPPKGTTANPEQDGLFDIGAAFSAGFGSRHGPGYIVEVRMVTLAHIPQEVRNEIQDEVVRQLRDALPAAFPGRTLHVERDGPVFKIHGDLSLGTI